MLAVFTHSVVTSPASVTVAVSLAAEPSDLGVERCLGLPLYKTCAGQVDEQQHAEHRGGKYEEVKRGQPKRMSSDDQSDVAENLRRRWAFFRCQPGFFGGHWYPLRGLLRGAQTVTGPANRMQQLGRISIVDLAP